MNLSQMNIESNKDSGKTKLTSIFVFIMLLVIVIGVAFFVYLKSNNIDLRNVSVKELFTSMLDSKEQKLTGNVWEMKSDPKEQPNFAVYGDYLIKCTKDRIEFYDKEARPVWDKSLQINNPVHLIR